MSDSEAAGQEKASASIRFDDARAFLVEDALPLWSSRGVYPNGCFVEHLAPFIHEAV